MNTFPILDQGRKFIKINLRVSRLESGIAYSLKRCIGSVYTFGRLPAVVLICSSCALCDALAQTLWLSGSANSWASVICTTCKSILCTHLLHGAMLWNKFRAASLQQKCYRRALHHALAQWSILAARAPEHWTLQTVANQ